ncbi:mechanosensitive ion channel protein MscS [Halobacteriovorax marinus]|uniref:mechanosensitive ion channel family protein n=1 Tax=Halobacteriovorax marinus TaxID=97084 RepID=UPI000BC2EE34|nr:mechanosensitive ion channel domain-containing protein [Halobacteriovorax marinus]ATH06642.1 mechanosensitive ion channel protein MscS [Halobacteriovorax marinus]
MNSSIDNIQKILMEKAVAFAPKLALALITLIIGLYIANFVTKLFTKALGKKKVDTAASYFLSAIIGICLKVAVCLSVLGILGVQTTSFIAVLGSVGLAFGLALQGSLSNLAGGVLLILLKPFKAGHVIEAQGVIGKVESISMVYTKLRTPDNRILTIPNGPLANGVINNITSQSTRRVDFTFGVGYGDDLKKAKEVIFKTITSDSRVLSEPEPFIAVSALADSSVNFVVRVWTKSDDYWGVNFDGIENVKLALDENGISIPFPQRDVHVIKDL